MPSANNPQITALLRPQCGTILGTPTETHMISQYCGSNLVCNRASQAEPGSPPKAVQGMRLKHRPATGVIPLACPHGQWLPFFKIG